jgi:hypothetical protein
MGLRDGDERDVGGIASNPGRGDADALADRPDGRADRCVPGGRLGCASLGHVPNLRPVYPRGKQARRSNRVGIRMSSPPIGGELIVHS